MFNLKHGAIFRLCFFAQHYRPISSLEITVTNVAYSVLKSGRLAFELAWKLLSKNCQVEACVCCKRSSNSDGSS